MNASLSLSLCVDQIKNENKLSIDKEINMRESKDGERDKGCVYA